MRYLLALFILIATASDPWIDSVMAGELTNSHQITSSDQFQKDSSSSFVDVHNQEGLPFHNDDCAECHSCHLGHCGILVPLSLWKSPIWASPQDTVYISQRNKGRPKDLYRPPKTIS